MRFPKQNARGDVPPTDPVRTRPDELAPLARAAAGGDPEAAATLVTRVAGSILRVVRKVLGPRHADVDDVAQDAVIALLRALGTFRGDCTVERFAERVALLTALDARRKQRVRRSDPEGEPALAQLASDGRSPLATTVARRRRALVRNLLDQLPEVIAEALALHFIFDHTVDEIAAAAAVSPNTIWSRLRLGKQALRRKLAGDVRLADLMGDGEP